MNKQTIFEGRIYYYTRGLYELSLFSRPLPYKVNTTVYSTLAASTYQLYHSLYKHYHVHCETIRALLRSLLSFLRWRKQNSDGKDDQFRLFLVRGIIFYRYMATLTVALWKIFFLAREHKGVGIHRSILFRCELASWRGQACHVSQINYMYLCFYRRDLYITVGADLLIYTLWTVIYYMWTG